MASAGERQNHVVSQAAAAGGGARQRRRRLSGGFRSVVLSCRIGAWSSCRERARVPEVGTRPPSCCGLAMAMAMAQRRLPAARRYAELAWAASD